MGKRGGKGGRGGRGGGRGGKPRDEPRERDETQWNTFAPVDMVNENFEEYYKAQNILTEDEWPAFMAQLKQELPTTFRVTGSREHAETIADVIKNVQVPNMQDVEHEGVKYSPPEQIPWYPAQLAWQVSAPKRIIRKSPPFKKFQRFLVGETEVGNLSRQEAVSMIPPLLLDIEPHHVCLDMCAAPGSKTAQMIESLNPHHTESTGILIANDSDYKRCHMLVHQTGRMPSKGLMVTNYDASIFPKIKLGKDENLRFDRILADVPCSGDGTLRKNVEIWKKWSTSDGNGLHSLQLRILHRAMDILKPGGRMVYSTCSFNPVENEAVVAAALNSRRGFRIVDASASIPHLKFRPGLTTWKVAGQPNGNNHGNAVQFFESFQAAEEMRTAGGNEKPSWRETAPTYYPPVNAKELGLEKCMRLVPHDQNTGGFFVCVLEKIIYPNGGEAAAAKAAKRAASPSTPEGAAERKKVKAEDKAEEAEADDVDIDADEEAAAVVPDEKEAGKKEKKDWSYKEDPFTFIDPQNAELASICKWFQMKDTFPLDQMLVRNDRGEALRVVYLTNALLKRVLENNSAQRLRIVSAGVKAFVRQDSQNRTDIHCKWRIPADGVAEVLPHVGEGVVKDIGAVGMEVLRILVEHPYPMVDHFPSGFKEWAEDAALGNFLLRFPAGEGHGGSLPLPLVVPIWKAKTSLSLLIDKREKSSLSLRTFGEDIVRAPLNKDQKLAKDAEAESGDVEDVAALMEGDAGNFDEEEMANAPALGAIEEAAL